MREVTARTRDPKLGLDSRDTLRQDWIDKAKALGFCPSSEHSAQLAA